MIDGIGFTSATLSSGSVVVSGSITCTSGDRGEVQITVSQGKGKNAVKGSAAIQDTTLATGSAAEWTITVAPESGAFSAGPAKIEIRGNSFRPPNYTFDGGKHMTTDVTLA